MIFPIVSEPILLKTDVDGVVRVGGTRVTLDTVVAAFTEGATAEEIVYQYPSLQLADVYPSQTETRFRHRSYPRCQPFRSR